MIDTELFVDTPKIDLRDTELLRSEFGDQRMSFDNYSKMLQTESPVDLNLQQAEDFEQMFPSEVLPEDLEQEDPFKFDPVDFSTPPLSEQFNRELGYTPPEYEMMSLEGETTEKYGTNEEVDTLREEIDRIPNITDLQREQLQQQVNQAYTQAQQEKVEPPPQLQSVTNPTQVSLLEDEPIKINPGFNTDLENFFSAIKNPPHWRVLGN